LYSCFLVTETTGSRTLAANRHGSFDTARRSGV